MNKINENNAILRRIIEQNEEITRIGYELMRVGWNEHGQIRRFENYDQYNQYNRNDRIDKSNKQSWN